MPLSSSRFDKIAGVDEVEVEDIKEQYGLLEEVFKEVKAEISNDFIDSIYEQYIVSKKLSDKQIQGLLNFHNNLVKD